LRQKTSSTSEYLAFLSAKYEVDPDRLFYALVLAEESKKSVCGGLSIEWRGETRDKVMFLILTKSKVVAQLSVFKEFLLEKGHPIRDFMETDKIPDSSPREPDSHRVFKSEICGAGWRRFV